MKKIYDKKIMKNIAVGTLLFSLGTLSSSIALADVPLFPAAPDGAAKDNGNNSDTNGTPDIGAIAIIKAIENLGRQIDSMNTANIQAKNQEKYQQDPYLTQGMQSHSSLNQLKQLTDQKISSDTQNEVTHSLQQISYAITPPTDNSEDQKNQQEWDSAHSMLYLTQGVVASDTPYVSSSNYGYLLDALRMGVAKPSEMKKSLNDADFNISSIFMPMSYSPDQLKAANKFMDYVLPLTDYSSTMINFSKLQGQGPEVMKRFINSDAWQNYDYNLRSSVALRSMASSSFASLIAERTPGNMVTINGKAASPSIPEVTDCEGNVIKNPSQLQIESYIANHRVCSTAWRNHINTASPATIQRETLFVLADLQSQMYQQHMDNEKMLVALTSMQALFSKLTALMNTTNVAQMNQAIDHSIRHTVITPTPGK